METSVTLESLNYLSKHLKRRLNLNYPKKLEQREPIVYLREKFLTKLASEIHVNTMEYVTLPGMTTDVNVKMDGKVEIALKKNFAFGSNVREKAPACHFPMDMNV